MTPQELLDFNLPLFAGVTADDLAGIPLAVSEKTFSAWQTIFDQDDDSHDLYFLLYGSLLAVYWTSEGREIVFSRFAIGAHFGELAALDGTPRSLAAVAKTETKVLILKRDCFLRLFNEVPPIRDRITRQLVARIRTLTERNMEMTTLSVEQRVNTYLLRLAAEHGKLCVGAVIENAPTHAEIAGTIGANREMVSRSISKLAKRGVIKSARQRIEFLDPAALSEDLS
ncbi:cAMP-binding domain of CRP or a regulatory subunit of cAMP-dependent protein kinases [Yoonia tamlensis]|uniref:cAMP-binding domain of CRP or a regulatory subunit of cAMP-dependent protein kinases n=1 Tax=Yoonia tamlensis TaxID=390270 RepID=A0A1I6HPG3_9RHOB|nr:Crp/Fnr family transcriptional regulator [Yoonia tamlensis]SFR56278.1 cAMP-binding domain of CRP or a regulatory subunit of cAMP-dependent protein kinases [Yoonia tamlensis]